MSEKSTVEKTFAEASVLRLILIKNYKMKTFVTWPFPSTDSATYSFDKLFRNFCSNSNFNCLNGLLNLHAVAGDLFAPLSGSLYFG